MGFYYVLFMFQLIFISCSFERQKISNAIERFQISLYFKLNKIWQIKVVNFNRSLKSWLHDSDIEMSSKNNEGSSVAAE